MPTVPAAVLDRYRAFSLYDSPYSAHDDGRAIDLYPDSGSGSSATAPPTAEPQAAAPSPVAGEVVAVERLGAPSKPYAPEHDVLLAIDTGATASGPTWRTPAGDDAVARILHVDPAVEIGDTVSVGDSLGELLRSGFFAPWVDPHLHLEFREPDANLLRAGGDSSPIELGVDVRPVSWDGVGTVREVGETYAVLDAPEHPAPGEAFAAIGGTVGATGAVGVERDDGATTRCVALDGGLAHYEFGGLLADGAGVAGTLGAVSLLGTKVGATADDSQTGSSRSTHRPIAWNGPTVTVDGEPIHGLSLAAARDRLGAKLVCPDLDLTAGQTVRVGIEP